MTFKSELYKTQGQTISWLLLILHNTWLWLHFHFCCTKQKINCRGCVKPLQFLLHLWKRHTHKHFIIFSCLLKQVYSTREILPATHSHSRKSGGKKGAEMQPDVKLGNATPQQVDGRTVRVQETPTATTWQTNDSLNRVMRSRVGPDCVSVSNKSLNSNK